MSPNVHLDDLWYRRIPSGDVESPLRSEVRAFLEHEREAGTFVPQCHSWMEGHDPAFSRKLGRRGWLGLTWPLQYGGGARGEMERFVVLEELLAAGAPVAAHWFGERQTGPSILRFGTEEQKMSILPRIARGEYYVAIGMSEPDSGSDLASVRTTARRVNGGWELTGTKVWISHAQRSHLLVALCRSAERSESRHAGLTQFIVDLQSPGVTITPIELMSGESHFAEVTLDSVHVPDSMVLGRVGEGWQQVSAELAYERSGPERFLSNYPLLVALRDQLGSGDENGDGPLFGSLVAELCVLRSMSRSIAEQLIAGSVPQIEAAIVKDLGAQFENAVLDAAALLEPRPLLRKSGGTYERLLAQAVLATPTSTLRGGTTEILRGIIASEIIS